MNVLGGYTPYHRNRTTTRRGCGRYHGGTIFWLHHSQDRFVEDHELDLDSSPYGGSEGVLYLQLGPPWMWFCVVMYLESEYFVKEYDIDTNATLAQTRLHCGSHLGNDRTAPREVDLSALRTFHVSANCLDGGL